MEEADLTAVENHPIRAVNQNIAQAKVPATKVLNQVLLSHMAQRLRARATIKTNIRASINQNTKKDNMQVIMRQEIGGTMAACLIQQ